MDAKLLGRSDKSNHKVIPEHSQNITKEKLLNLLPKRTNVAITDEILQLINTAEDDTGLPQELVEEDVMSYMHLLADVKGIGMRDLVNAIKFCNLKRNYDNKDAWAITFPDKYDRLISNNKQVDNHVSMYNASKLVVAIDKEMLIPVSIQYATYFHAAVNKQFNVMNGKGALDKDGKPMTVSPMVQHLAAKELAVLTKPIEEAKLSINVNPGAQALSMQEEMNEQLRALVATQSQRLAAGESISSVQKIDIHFDDITDAEVL